MVIVFFWQPVNVTPEGRHLMLRVVIGIFRDGIMLRWGWFLKYGEFQFIIFIKNSQVQKVEFQTLCVCVLDAEAIVHVTCPEEDFFIPISQYEVVL